MSGFPASDTEYEEKTIASVENASGTYAVTFTDGWSFWCGENAPITPEPGMSARLYGRGVGGFVRGLFINGVEFYYRTVDADAEQRDIEMYGADAADWLARWDAGRSVWSISMGGIGPGYEQCIQIVAAEVLRWLLANQPDMSSDWHKHDGEMSRAVTEKTRALGLSGAQWGAGVNLAANLYRQGPRGVMHDTRVRDRRIQVSRTMPEIAA